MRPNDFFFQNPVFTRKEYDLFCQEKNHTSTRSQEALLSYHLKAGNLIRVRRGLFAVIPQGAVAESFAIDPYLVASKLTDDAIIAYHSALAFFGKSYSLTHQFCVLTNKRPAKFIFRDDSFRLISFPKALCKKDKALLEVKTVFHRGTKLSITGFERTLVDMLDRPELSNGWEEIWRSLETVEYFDVEKVIEYALLLGNATTIALVGFYLEQHHKELNVKERQLKKLEAKRPKQPHYIDRKQKISRKFNTRWNIIIPKEIVAQSWNE